MKGVLSFGFSLLVCGSAMCAKQPSSEEFLKMVRKPKMQSAWARLEGKAVHKRDAVKSEEGKEQKAMKAKADIYLAMVFKPGSILGKVLFDKNELYTLGQIFSSGIAGSTARKEGCVKDETDKMRETFGISVDDLSLSFLYWDLDKEQPSDTVRLFKCRVFDLKNDQKKEKVRVWIYPGWLAPLKAEWFKYDEVEPYRTAEFTSTKKVGEDMYMIKSFKLSNSSWKTEVTFSTIEAAKTSDKRPPQDLLLQKISVKKTAK